MNRLHFILFISLLFAFTLVETSCKKAEKVKYDDSGFSKEPLDISDLNIPKDNGSIGLVVDVRPIIKKGYPVSEVKVEIEGVLSSFSQTPEVDQFTDLAILWIKRDGLTAVQIEQFTKGVRTAITTYDPSGSEVSKTTESILLHNNSGEPFAVETDKASKAPQLEIEEGIERGKEEIARNLIASNQFTTTQISNLAGVPESFVQRIQAAMNKK